MIIWLVLVSHVLLAESYRHGKFPKFQQRSWLPDFPKYRSLNVTNFVTKAAANTETSVFVPLTPEPVFVQPTEKLLNTPVDFTWTTTTTALTTDSTTTRPLITRIPITQTMIYTETLLTPPPDTKITFMTRPFETTSCTTTVKTKPWLTLITKQTLHTMPYPFCWTDWFDIDDPTATGDWEVLWDIRVANPGKVCPKPLQMQVLTTSGQPVSSTGDVIYKSDPLTGFICRNKDQRKGNRCSDYKVRFGCPRSFCAPPPQCWTEWFDRDNPSGTGDWETLEDLRSEYPGRICPKPLQIQVQTTSGAPMSSTGDNIYKADILTGFICRNRDQRKGRCQDYKVRFLCPLSFCIRQRCYTDWFDRDDPSGTGDWETLFALRADYPGQICNNPLQIQVESLDGDSVATTGNIISVMDVVTGFICNNSMQPSKMCEDFRVRFFCPHKFCQEKVCWTKWFDRDDPTGSGDWELLVNLRKEYPKEICKIPLYIDVRTVDTNEPITVTGQNWHIYSPTEGFACRNQDQKECACRDYKVRFGCPCDCVVDTE
ncbi:hypothetical protein WMY93_028915 [Mugilogobius chulae]|uniref:WxxW domain-containing protein n=1 Tax=Mugilogobius chulae TaxID=88201 RepID=A0AAW0MU65_9GOBI